MISLAVIDELWKRSSRLSANDLRVIRDNLDNLEAMRKAQAEIKMAARRMMAACHQLASKITADLVIDGDEAWTEDFYSSGGSCQSRISGRRAWFITSDHNDQQWSLHVYGPDPANGETPSALLTGFVGYGDAACEARRWVRESQAIQPDGAVITEADLG